MSSRKKAAATKPAGKRGDVEWSVRGRGQLPAELTGDASASATPELATLVESSAYRILELIPQLEEEEILRAVDGFELDAPLTLFIMQKQEGVFGPLTTFEAADWIEGNGPELVGKMFGPGTYQLRLQGKKEGMRRWVKQPTFRIPGVPRSVNGVAAPPAQRGASVTEIIGAIAAGITAVTPLLKAAFARPEPPAAADPVAMLKVFQQGVEMGKTMKGDQDDGFGRTLREVLPGALESLKQLGGPSSSTPAPAQLPPGPAGVAPPTWVLMIQPHVGQLVNVARIGADVDHVAAQMVHRFMNGEQQEMLAEQLDRGEAFRLEFFQYFPEAQPLSDWFSRLLDAAGEELEDDGDSDETPNLEQQNNTRDGRLPGFDGA